MGLSISDMVGYGPVAFAGVLRSKARVLRAEADDLDRIAAALEGQHRRASAEADGRCVCGRKRTNCTEAH